MLYVGFQSGRCASSRDGGSGGMQQLGRVAHTGDPGTWVKVEEFLP